jgi:hypothetical protein
VSSSRRSARLAPIRVCRPRHSCSDSGHCRLQPIRHISSPAARGPVQRRRPLHRFVRSRSEKTSPGRGGLSYAGRARSGLSRDDQEWGRSSDIVSLALMVASVQIPAFCAAGYAGGELRHIVWEATGFAGVDYDTVYLVFDPSDSLSKTRMPGKPMGIPCLVRRVTRLERGWYTVRFYTDEEWGYCPSNQAEAGVSH